MKSKSNRLLRTPSFELLVFVFASRLSSLYSGVDPKPVLAPVASLKSWKQGLTCVRLSSRGSTHCHRFFGDSSGKGRDDAGMGAGTKAPNGGREKADGADDGYALESFTIEYIVDIADTPRLL